MTTPNGDDLAFNYNENGIRTWKMVNNTFKSFTLDGSKILIESSAGNQNYVIYYYYDAIGSVTGFNYNGTTYYYGKNIQGDIKFIYNTSGSIVTEYCYDAWGNILSTTGTLASTVGAINPFRYRGYYYDSETGFYYLNSRYYDPQVGRFINADAILGANGDLVGYNLFAYCSNNPVMYVDPTGRACYEDMYWGLAGYSAQDNFGYYFYPNLYSDANAVDYFMRAVQSLSWVPQQFYDLYDQIAASGKYPARKPQLNMLTSPQQPGIRTLSPKEFEQLVLDASEVAIKTTITVGNFVVDRFSTPEKASNTFGVISGALGVVSAYSAGVAFGLSIPTLGMSIPTAGTVAAVTGIAAGVCGLVSAVINIFDEE